MNAAGDDQQSTPTKSVLARVLGFFPSPLGAATGWMIGAVGLVFALVTYETSKPVRLFALCTNPIETVIVKAGATSRLGATFDGELVTSDITAQQVAFWNDGNQSIRPENILSPIVVDLDGVPILDVTVRKVTRDLIDLRLDKSDARHGKVGIAWKILEPGDGFVLQVIYAGAPGALLHAGGAIEGMSAARRPPMPAPPPVTLSNARRSATATAGITAAVALLGMVMFAVILVRPLPHNAKSRAARWVPAALVVMFAALGVTAFVNLMRTLDGPPFGF
jgi:hypothetical protein